MRGIYSLAVLLTIMVLLIGCLTDKGELTEDVTSGFCDSLNVTYIDTMQILIDTHCAFVGCHSSGFAQGDFTSFSNMQNYGALEQSKIGARVASTDPAFVMPLGNPLPDSIKVIFECWADAGFPQQ